MVSEEHLKMVWKPGPLPPGTWNWGGVVPVGENAWGFFFADFCGDHVKLVPSGRVLKAEEVAFYNNGLELPPQPSADGSWDHSMVQGGTRLE